MSIREGFISIRSHLVFLVALICSFSAVIYLEMWDPRQVRDHFFNLEPTMEIDLAGPMPLDASEREVARIAWRYFANNTQPATGLVNSVDGVPTTTVWDQASYLLGLISAERLGIVDRSEFDARTAAALDSLAALPLFDNKLPNRRYHAVDLSMLDDDGNPSVRGTGWSAIDIARLAVPLSILVWNYPTHTPQVGEIVRRWDWHSLARDGFLVSARLVKNEVEITQEGRLGFEEYASRALRPLGVDVSEAEKYLDYLIFARADGIYVPVDARSPSHRDPLTLVANEAYVLDGLEHGFNPDSGELAYRVYRAQEESFRETGRLSLSRSTPQRVNTGAAFGWDALFGTPFTRRLVDHVATAKHPERGWYASVRDTGTDNPSHNAEDAVKANGALDLDTNALVLESLAYREFGPLAALTRSRARPTGPATATLARP